MPTPEDERLTREAITAEVEDEEHIRFDIRGVANLQWDEDPAPGRPEMTGQWLLCHRDGTSEEIDLPQANTDGAIALAKGLIAKSLTNP